MLPSPATSGGLQVLSFLENAALIYARYRAAHTNICFETGDMVLAEADSWVTSWSHPQRFLGVLLKLVTPNLSGLGNERDGCTEYSPSPLSVREGWQLPDSPTLREKWEFLSCLPPQQK